MEGKAWVKGQSLEEELGNPTEEIDVVSPDIGFQRMIRGCRRAAPADPGYSKERRCRQGSGNNCLIKR